MAQAARNPTARQEHLMRLSPRLSLVLVLATAALGLGAAQTPHGVRHGRAVGSWDLPSAIPEGLVVGTLDSFQGSAAPLELRASLFPLPLACPGCLGGTVLGTLDDGVGAADYLVEGQFTGTSFSGSELRGALHLAPLKGSRSRAAEPQVPARRDARAPAGRDERGAGVLLDQRRAGEGAAGRERIALQDGRSARALEHGRATLADGCRRQGTSTRLAHGARRARDARAHAQAHELDLALRQGVAVEARVRAVELGLGRGGVGQTQLEGLAAVAQVERGLAADLARCGALRAELAPGARDELGQAALARAAVE
jgi:hypothetical protein